MSWWYHRKTQAPPIGGQRTIDLSLVSHGWRFKGHHAVEGATRDSIDGATSEQWRVPTHQIRQRATDRRPSGANDNLELGLRHSPSEADIPPPLFLFLFLTEISRPRRCSPCRRRDGVSLALTDQPRDYKTVDINGAVGEKLSDTRQASDSTHLHLQVACRTLARRTKKALSLGRGVRQVRSMLLLCKSPPGCSTGSMLIVHCADAASISPLF